ncbi:MAG: DUF4377 domain-containing protein [Bacteroidales bacterium]|nr:DUF4377 domain-containing protein [Bacteroidales bacterium]
MKRLFFVASISILSFGLIGCFLLDFDQNKEKTITATFTVAPDLVEFFLYSIDYPEEKITKYAIELTNEKTKEVFLQYPNSIYGFTYEEGFTYRIKVLITYVGYDPNNTVRFVLPQGYTFGEGGNTYKLKEVISKKNARIAPY